MPAQRLEADDYCATGDGLSTLTKCAARLLSLYEQVHPIDLDTAIYLLAQALRQVGDGVNIQPPLRVDYGYNISIGDGSWVNYGLTMLDVAPVVIGTDVLTGPSCSLYTAIRPSKPGPRRAKWESSAPTTLEDNTWLGGSIVMRPGVAIGENSVISAGTVVARGIPANSVVMGNPVRVIKNLDPVTPYTTEATGTGLAAYTGDHA